MFSISLTCPALLGCLQSKHSTDGDPMLNGIKESELGTEVDLDVEPVREIGTNVGVLRERVDNNEEEIVPVNTQSLHAVNDSTDSGPKDNYQRKQKKEQSISTAAPTLNKNWLDFPFLIDQKTVTHLSKGKSKVMFIMRGAPGSGKSSIVKVLKSSYPDVVVCSADDFFTSEDGVYNFDFTKLPAAHGSCQHKAKSACEGGKPLIIIDNTNVKRWEMKSYLSDAKQFGYVVILVEPKTDWKFDPEELAHRNSHGVPLDILKQRVGAFEHIIPLYYGWFLSLKKSEELTSFASNVFTKCLEQYPSFQRELLKSMNISSQQLSPEVVQDYYSEKGKTTSLLHCTSRFCGGGKASGGKKYDSRPEVQAACGRVFRLTLTGLVMTKKTMGLRVTLDDHELPLFDRPEESAWTGSHSSGDHHSPGKRHGSGKEGTSSPSPSPSSGSEGSGKSKRARRKEKKLLAKQKISTELNESVVTAGSKPKPSLSDLVQARISQMDYLQLDDEHDGDDDENEIDFSKENLGSLTEELSHSTSGSTINTLFPELRNSGFARSAHITVQTAQGIQAVETNYDVLHICDLEHKRQHFDPSDFVSVPRGRAFYFGEGVCCVYFDQPIRIDAVFSGHY